jgi:hypothetical protein
VTVAPPSYRERLEVEGYSLAALGAIDCLLLLALTTQSRRWPSNTIGQLAVVAVLVAGLGPRAVRRAVAESVELAPGGEGSGEPTPLWQLPPIVAGLTLLVGLSPAGGWDAGVRIGGGCVIVGLGQAVLMGRLVARAEAETGRRYVRVKGSRIGRGTKLGWTPR